MKLLPSKLSGHCHSVSAEGRRPHKYFTCICVQAWLKISSSASCRGGFLKGEEWCRYARALVSREITALDLQEAMLSQEIDEASAEEATADAGVVRANEEVTDAEGELSRVQLEGPANHRKRDPIDKVSSLFDVLLQVNANLLCDSSCHSMWCGGRKSQELPQQMPPAIIS